MRSVFKGQDPVARVEQAVDQLRGRMGRYWKLVPALSLIWGIVSGWLLTRDYAHSQHLLAALGVFVVVSIVARFRASRVTGEGRPRDLTYGAALFATRFVVQYIVVFCIPLLALASAWVTLTCAVALAVISFSSRLWTRFAKWPWFAATARCFTMVLATSFGFVVFFPQRLGSFYPVLGTIAIVAALPWGGLRRKGLPSLSSFLPTLLVAAVVGGQALTQAWIRFPPLALWLRKPAIGVGISGRNLVEPWSPSVTSEKLATAIASGSEICCLTPVVSPRGVKEPVVHEWLADGEVVERIVLPPINGTHDEGEAAFRTYSCKRNLGAAAAALHRLECRAYLGGSLYLGRASVTFSP